MLQIVMLSQLKLLLLNWWICRSGCGTTTSV